MNKKSLNYSQRKIVTLASIGGMLEFYDFAIYGLFATYFAHQFFPATNEFLSIIATYSAFVVGYVVRPIGGIVFGYIGDVVGRKKVLIITMILMGVSSFLVGLLQTYQQIGILAPILMISLRALQGFAIGGELPSTIVYVTESIPNKKFYVMGIVFAMVIAGLIPAMFINLFMVKYLTVDQLSGFGWRIPFLLGAIICVIGYRVRKTLHETKVFERLSHNKYGSILILELLKNYWGRLLVGIGVVSLLAIPIILLVIFMPTYLISIVKFDKRIVSYLVFMSTMIIVIMTFISGYLANRYGGYRLALYNSLFLLITSGICYYLLYIDRYIFVGVTLFAVCEGFLTGLVPTILSDIFPVEYRMQGVALSYNLGFAVFGGLTPVIVTGLIERTNSVFLIPFLVVSVASILGFIALIFSRSYLLGVSTAK